ncbi:MAG: hypothetical protein KF680_05850 [Cryobacterium sp.]|nr:hypothetical protein [Cryobacterium sp.]
MLLGYRVVARTTADSPPFQLVVADRHGRLATPPPSGDVTRHRLSVMTRDDRELELASTGMMFIDDLSGADAW